jgi:N-acetylneuraminate synthase
MFEIDGRKVGRLEKPYIIAELSANHGGSIDNAKMAIDSAKSSGVSAVKIQTYTPDTMTIDCDKPDFQITEGLWKGYSLYELYREAYTPFEWHKELFDYARSAGITLFSTPFDGSAVDLLESLNTPAYKIASFELIDLPLIKRVAECKKPVLMSTGMASLSEIGEAVEVARSYGSGDILLFHCISSYPAKTEESNLTNILTLAREFGVEVGLSDHTMSNLAATVAVGLGACMVEKHFKPFESSSGADASFSITPLKLRELVDCCDAAWLSIGTAEFSRSSTEDKSKIHRRSIYFLNDLKTGYTLKESDIKSIRPGFGLPPKHYDELIGKVLTADVDRGDPVSWDCFGLK